MKSRLFQCAVLVAALTTTAACGGDSMEGTVQTSPTSPSSGPVNSPSGGPTAGADAPLEDLPVSPSGRVITVNGTVQTGVEKGCLLLSTGETLYLLLGETGELRPGAAVTVTGTVGTGLMSYCMQGEPLRVDRISPSPS